MATQKVSGSPGLDAGSFDPKSSVLSGTTAALPLPLCLVASARGPELCELGQLASFGALGQPG